jgi:RNA polymerase sigma factor (sigma-70 family)
MGEESPLKGEGDKYLIDSIRKGDQSAFRQLVDRFSGRLTAYAARRVAGTGIDPEDAVQETFLGLLQNLEKGRERLSQVRSLEAYLFQVLRNKIFDLTAKRPEAHGMRRVPLADQDADGIIEGFEPVAAGGTPSNYVQREEDVQVRARVLADILEEVISRLKDEKSFRDLKVLELLFLSSLKNREIATAVGTSEPTVTRVKQDALERLSRAAARHPLGGGGFTFPETEEGASDLIRKTWRANLLSCVKRSTLGAYSLGALEKEWKDYVTFHLETVGCEACAANLQDMREGGKAATPESRERVFASSIGFLKKLGKN